jgi:hypothetical protein
MKVKLSATENRRVRVTAAVAAVALEVERRVSAVVGVNVRLMGGPSSMAPAGTGVLDKGGSSTRTGRRDNNGLLERT